MIYAQTGRGFTLVETVLALFIMSVTISFVVVVAGSIKEIRDSTYKSIAFRIADSKLNDLRSLGYDSLPASGAFTSSEFTSLPSGSASTTVIAWNAKTKQVMTGVSWIGSDTKVEYVSLTTLITQSGGL